MPLDGGRVSLILLAVSSPHDSTRMQNLRPRRYVKPAHGYDFANDRSKEGPSGRRPFVTPCSTPALLVPCALRQWDMLKEAMNEERGAKRRRQGDAEQREEVRRGLGWRQRCAENWAGQPLRKGGEGRSRVAATAPTSHLPQRESPIHRPDDEVRKHAGGAASLLRLRTCASSNARPLSRAPASRILRKGRALHVRAGREPRARPLCVPSARRQAAGGL